MTNQLIINVNKDKDQDSSFYEQDYHLWLEQIVYLLKEKIFSELDLDNLIKEIESMGRSEKNALRSNLRVLLMHLLKYKFQPQKRSNSCLYTIYEHRLRLQEAFLDSPSLKSYYLEIFANCYQNARTEASIETGLPLAIFPNDSPFSVNETLDSDFFPN
jgi:predicted DNA-binding ribbon-helix-helix protein